MKHTKTLILIFIISLFQNLAVAYEVIEKANNQLPITAIHINFRVGSADDPAGKEGIAAITAAMVREGGVKKFKGQKAQTRAEIEEYLYPLAGELGVTVAREQTSFTITVSQEDSHSALDLLAQMILAPAWDNGEFERIKTETLDELENQIPREDQEELGKEVLNQKIFGNTHPYSHLVEGTKKSIKALTLDDVKKFYQDFYIQKRLLVGFAGVDPGGLENKLGTVFSYLAMGTTSKAQVPVSSRTEGLHLTIVEGPFPSTGVHIGSPLSFNRSNLEKFAPMYLTSIAFGKHRSFVGRLMNVVREIRSLNYGTYSYVEDFPHGGHRSTEPTQAARQIQMFTMWGRPTPLENGCFLLKQMHRELKKLSTEGLTEAEFELSQSHLVGSLPMLALSLERRLAYAVDAFFYGIYGDYIPTLQQKIGSLSRSKVNTEIKKHLNPANVEIVVVTPEAKDFKKQILGANCDIHYANGVQKPEDVLKEDKEISSYSLGIKEENIEIINVDTLF